MKTWNVTASAAVVAVTAAAAWIVATTVDAEEKVPDAPAAETKEPADKNQKDAKPPEGGRDDLPLRDYMRLKLEASNLVLEGLCTDDAELVEQGARKLNEMSSSERWRVTNDPMYRQFSGDFREITQQLVEAAEKKNMDRAALKWMDATMGCIECHRFVRGIRLAGDAAEGKSLR
jgi:hypothetical protein